MKAVDNDFPKSDNNPTKIFMTLPISHNKAEKKNIFLAINNKSKFWSALLERSVSYFPPPCKK